MDKYVTERSGKKTMTQKQFRDLIKLIVDAGDDGDAFKKAKDFVVETIKQVNLTEDEAFPHAGGGGGGAGPGASASSGSDALWDGFLKKYKTHITPADLFDGRGKPLRAHLQDHKNDLAYEDVMLAINTVTHQLEDWMQSFTRPSDLEIYLNHFQKMLVTTRLCKRTMKVLCCPRWKKVKDYIPYRLQLIVNIPNGFSKEQRSVQVKDLTKSFMVKRHGDGSISFITSKDNAVERVFKNTLVLTIWVLEHEKGGRPIRWIFGTSYVSDHFPYETPSLMPILKLMAAGIKVRETPSQIQKLAKPYNSGPMYALLPPGTPLETVKGKSPDVKALSLGEQGAKFKREALLAAAARGQARKIITDILKTKKVARSSASGGQRKRRRTRRRRHRKHRRRRRTRRHRSRRRRHSKRSRRRHRKLCRSHR